MGLAQRTALGGKRLRPGYVEEINAQKSSLPQLYGLKSAQDYRDKIYEQQQKSFGIQENEFDLAKKRAKTAKNLGYAGLGVQGVTGLASAYPGLKEIGSDIVDFVTPEPASAAGSAINFTGAEWNPTDFLTSSLTETLNPLLKFATDTGSSIADSLFGDVIDQSDFDYGFDDLF